MPDDDLTAAVASIPDSDPGTGVITTEDEPPADDERVEQVVKWIIDGNSAYDIEQSIRETWPDASVQQLALAATQKLIDAAKITPDVVKGFCIEATREMYRKLVEIGEFAQALRAIRQLWDMTNTVKL